MTRIVVRVVFILVLAVIVGILSRIFGGKSRKQARVEQDGRFTMRMSTNAGIVFLALGIIMFVVVTFFVYMAFTTEENIWEEAGPMIILCEGLVLLMVLLGAWMTYYIRANLIIFDQEKIVVSKPLKAERELRWETVGALEIQDVQCVLYDRSSQILLRVNAGWDGFAQFCQVAQTRVKENGGQVRWK